MSRAGLARYLTPWKFRREQQARQIAELRDRDGDECRRCRRPIRFDLTPGHDKGPRIEGAIEGDGQALDGMFLCHGRCNAAGADSTAEVTERIRRRNEAALFVNARESGEALLQVDPEAVGECKKDERAQAEDEAMAKDHRAPFARIAGLSRSTELNSRPPR